MENKRVECINRDMNVVNNMVNIVKTYLTDKIRPLRFRRNVTLDVERSKIHQHIQRNLGETISFSKK
jgi:hypothetical protein